MMLRLSSPLLYESKCLAEQLKSILTCIARYVQLMHCSSTLIPIASFIVTCPAQV